MLFEIDVSMAWKVVFRALAVVEHGNEPFMLSTLGETFDSRVASSFAEYPLSTTQK